MISWRLGSAFALLATMILALVAGSVHFVFSYLQSRMSDIGELQTEQRRVTPENARIVEADLVMGVGNLTLEGGASELMEAEFQHYTPPLYTQMGYTVAGEDGILFLIHANPDVVPNFERDPQFQSKATIKLNNNVPLSLTVGLAVHTGYLQLTGLNLSNLNIIPVTGFSEIDLRDEWQHSFAVEIEDGFGNAFVRLPAKTAVRVRLLYDDANVIMRGLTHSGEYFVNDALNNIKNDETPVTIDVIVNADKEQGQVRLEVEP